MRYKIVWYDGFGGIDYSKRRFETIEQAVKAADDAQFQYGSDLVYDIVDAATNCKIRNWQKVACPQS